MSYFKLISEVTDNMDKRVRATVFVSIEKSLEYIV